MIASTLTSFAKPSAASSSRAASPAAISRSFGLKIFPTGVTGISPMTETARGRAGGSGMLSCTKAASAWGIDGDAGLRRNEQHRYLAGIGIRTGHGRGERDTRKLQRGVLDRPRRRCRYSPRMITSLAWPMM